MQRPVITTITHLQAVRRYQRTGLQFQKSQAKISFVYSVYSSLRSFLSSNLDSDLFVYLCIHVFPFSSFSYHLLNLSPSFLSWLRVLVYLHLPVFPICSCFQLPSSIFLVQRTFQRRIETVENDDISLRFGNWTLPILIENNWILKIAQRMWPCGLQVHDYNFRSCPRAVGQTLRPTRWLPKANGNPTRHLVCTVYRLPTRTWLSNPALGDFRLLRLVMEPPWEP